MPVNSTSPVDWWDMPDNTWYRIELLVKFGGNNQYRLFPRYYAVNNPGVDDDGSLLYDWEDFRAWELSGTSLADFYGNPPTSGWKRSVGKSDFRTLSFGNNGSPQSGVGYWWVVDIKVVDGTNLEYDDAGAWVGTN